MTRFFEHYTHQRNYGCRIRQYVYRGVDTLTLENELLRITVLVGKGTDIVEFLYKPMDLDVMWHSPNGIRNPGERASRPDAGAAFLDTYPGGWQELFPSIADECDYKGAPLGLHGEVCHIPWEADIELDSPQEVRVGFRVRTPRSPYLLNKTLTLKSEDPTLYIHETVVNEGREELQFMWGHHPAFGPLFLDPSCTIEIPDGCRSRTHSSDLGDNMVLPPDTEFEWPHINGLDGTPWDLSRVPPPESEVYQMFYFRDLPVGRYSLTNHNHGLRFSMSWDKELFPILWAWAPYGGAAGYPWYGRAYALALEPWSAIPHNLSVVAGENRGIHIRPGETIRTSLSAAITAIR